MTQKTVLFIHGMFMTPLCWQEWLAYYQAKGYEALAPAWPNRDQSVQMLRQMHPDAQLGKLGLADVVTHYTAILSSMPAQPVLIGHSMGGLVVQILLEKGWGAAGIAINSAPPMGVFTTQWSFIKSNWPMINPFISGHQPHLMTFPQFQYAFVNGLPLAEQQTAYDTQVVPESRRVPRQSLTSVAQIDYKQQKKPLLFIAGTTDQIIPPSLNRTNYRKYNPSLTDFQEFAGRTHYIIGQKGWQEVADHTLTWLNKRGF